MTTAAYTVVDFRAEDAAGEPLPGPQRDVPYWRAIICPDPIPAATPFRVTVLARALFDVDWPYSVPDGPATISAETHEERISLAGRQTIETVYPIQRITTAHAVNDLVDIRSGAIAFTAGALVTGVFAVAGRLVLDRPMRGGIDLEYVGEMGQAWDFPGEAAGEYLLGLTSEMLTAPERRVLTLTSTPAPALDPCAGNAWNPGGGGFTPIVIDNFVSSPDFQEITGLTPLSATYTAGWEYWDETTNVPGVISGNTRQVDMQATAIYSDNKVAIFNFYIRSPDALWNGFAGFVCAGMDATLTYTWPGAVTNGTGIRVYFTLDEYGSPSSVGAEVSVDGLGFVLPDPVPAYLDYPYAGMSGGADLSLTINLADGQAVFLQGVETYG